MQNPVKHNNVYWDDAIVTDRKTFTVGGGPAIGAVATVTDSVRITQTVPITIDRPSEVPGAVTWTAALTNTSGMSISASPLSGTSGESITVIIDTDSLAQGVYQADLVITPDDSIVGDPFEIQLIGLVANEVSTVFLPRMIR